MNRRDFISDSLKAGTVAALTAPPVAAALAELPPETPGWVFTNVPLLALDKPDRQGLVFPSGVVEAALDEHRVTFSELGGRGEFVNAKLEGYEYDPPRHSYSSFPFHRSPVFNVPFLDIVNGEDGPVLEGVVTFNVGIGDDFDFGNPRCFDDVVPERPDLCFGLKKGEMAIRPAFKHMRVRWTGEFVSLDFDHFVITRKKDKASHRDLGLRVVVP